MSQFDYQQTPSGCYCTVKPGNTFYTIAHFFNASMDAIMKANPGLDPDKLVVGQRIFIPAGCQNNIWPPNSPSCCSSNLPPCPPPYPNMNDCNYYQNNYSGTCGTPQFSNVCQDGVHIVQPGEDLCSIAVKYNTTVATIRQANPWLTGEPTPGTRLCVRIHRNRYTNPQCHLSFCYPSNWIQKTENRYEGNDGFFQIVVMDGKSMNFDDVVHHEAYKVTRPYGTHPMMCKISIQGHEAAKIYPSQDQPMEMHEQAAIVIHCLRPFQIEGQSFFYIVILTRRSFVDEIAQSIEFKTV